MIPGFLAGRIRPGMRRGTRAVADVLARLGHPETRVPGVLIGGTNGKGSTQAILASILQTSGYRVGTFSSPSLTGFFDQFQIAGRPVEPAFVEHCGKVVAAEAGSGHLTLFEYATVLAFLSFFRSDVDIMLIEVGMGGGGDATNVFQPLISVVTLIAEDHLETLGGSLGSIVREKAATARRGRPLVTGASGESLELLLEICRNAGSFVDVLGRDFVVEASRAGAVFRSGSHSIGPVVPGLLGRHQLHNAALAMQVGIRLRSLGWEIPESAFREGVAAASLPGRLEWMTGEDGLRVLVDGAHNAHGVGALTTALREIDLPRPLRVGLAVYRDKDVEGMARLLSEVVDAVYCTRSRQERALEPAELLQRWTLAAGGRVDAIECASIKDVVDLFREASAGSNVFCGSLSVVEEVRAALASTPWRGR